MSLTDPANLARLSDTLTALRLVMPNVLEREREVAHSKWYAYRFMSPLEATKHFAEAYKVGFKAYVRAERDLNEAERVQGLGTRIFSHPNSSLTEVWNARQRADKLGLPYELLVEFGFYFASRRKWKNAPRPAQLFGSVNSDVAWPIEFEKWLVDRLPLAINRLNDIPQYHIDNYRGFPVQDEFRAYLLESMTETHGNWNAKLEHHCLITQHLPVWPAMKLVPKSLRHNVVNHLRLEMNFQAVSLDNQRLENIALAPACFGIPGAHSDQAQLCLECPLFTTCARSAGKASEVMIKKHGSISQLADSRDNKRRVKTNERGRRYRLRQKEMKALAGASSEPEKAAL